MGFNFPSSPADGAIYITPNGRQYVYGGGVWRMSMAVGVSKTLVTVADAPPPTAYQGELWWESDSGNLFLRYDDGDSQQWVQTNVSSDPDHLSSAAQDMYAGFKTGAKFVINDKADGTGTDRFTIDDTGVMTVPGSFIAGGVTGLNGASVVAGSVNKFSLSEAGGLALVNNASYSLGLYNQGLTSNLLLGPAVISAAPSLNFQISGTTKMTLSAVGTLVISQPASGYTCQFNGISGGGSLFYCAGLTQYGICGYNNGSGSNYSFYGNTGALLSAGVWATSDARAKENITEIDTAQALETVKAIKAKHFYNKLSERDECGWIAQEVQPHIPEAVSEDLVPEIDTHTRELLGLPLEGDASMFNMNDKSMIAHLWAAVQALAAQVEELKAAR